MNLLRSLFFIYIALVLMFIEGLSYFVVSGRSGDIRPPEEIISNLSQESLSSYFAEHFDRDLGWAPKPGFESGELGSRGNPWSYSISERGFRNQTNHRDSAATLAVTFGDSFTFGFENEDDETWQSFLTDISDSNVFNFGVNGYGPDQAYLRSLRFLKQHWNAKYALLVITEENLNRMVNRYRPFYQPEEDMLLGFKPRYSVDDNYKVVLKPQELAEPTSSHSRLLEKIEASKENDFWARRRPVSGSPYFFVLLQQAVVGFCDRVEVTAFCERRRLPKWNDETLVRIMDWVIDDFVAVSSEAGPTPGFLFIPLQSSVAFNEYVRRTGDRLGKTALVMSLSEIEGYEHQEMLSGSGIHFSRAANRVVAEFLNDELSD